tara:strand:+ start:96 stop:944 length:849 start_codon:yes stop_codon:yes gene_type:complete
MFFKKEYYHCIENKVINIKGIDKFDFIQGIISNDINLLKKNIPIYSAMLTPQGRFLFDFFITMQNDTFFLECNENYLDPILKKLELFKLRSNVEIFFNENINVLYSNEKNVEKIKNDFPDILSFNDPRFKNLFSRIYISKTNLDSLKKMKKSFINRDVFENFRLKNYIPDFFYDAIYEKSLLLELRFDELNGISWKKGCFMGQEITARMKYRGLLKKKIYGVKIIFNTFLESEIKSEDENIGKLFSNNKKFGIALIDCKKINGEKEYLCGDSKIKIQEPCWN